MSQLQDARQPAEFERGLAAAAAAPVVFDDEIQTTLKRIQRFLHAYPTIVPFIVLLMGVTLGASVNWVRFTTGSNLSTILLQVTIIGILGIAQTLIILTAGIDLSVGIMMVLSSIVMGRLCVALEWPVWVGFPVGILVGTLCGVVNGTLVTRLRMPPFIVTLGTLSIFTALNTWYSQDRRPIRERRYPDSTALVPARTWARPFQLRYGPDCFYGSVFTVGDRRSVFSYMLSRTAFGRHIYATGDDPDAARLAGIRTDRVLARGLCRSPAFISRHRAAGS